MILLPFFLIGLIALVAWLIKIVSRNFDYFERRGVKFRKPYPFIGTNLWLPLRRIFADYLQESYNAFSTEKLFGLFDFQTPILIVKHPDVIKRFTVKDFDYFIDHKRVSNTKSLINSTLLFMKGQKWREMRSSLSPAFTGSKMRLMFDLISNCGQQMIDTINDDYKKAGLHPHDIKDLFTKFTNDVIATCAFGIKCDSFKEPDNEVYEIGRKFVNLRRPAVMLKMLMIRFFPTIAKLLNVAVLDSRTKQFFKEVIIDTMATRERDKIVRPDMINILIQLKKGELKSDSAEDTQTEGAKSVGKKDWTETDLIAQCFIFFLAGFETSSTLMIFTAHELAMNPEIQAKLREEVENVKEKLDGKPITFEAIQSMKYMEMVIQETLRKWPPVLKIDRICVKPYKYEDEDGVKFSMNEGDVIWIPIYALHRDPEYFPNPEKFDPERFNEKNKININSNTYLPFGVGPRICIGSRFALLETKVVLFYLIANFSLEVCKETVIPLKLRRGILSVTPEKSVVLNLKPLGN